MSSFFRSIRRSVPVYNEADKEFFRRNLDLAGVPLPTPKQPKKVGLFRLGWRYFHRIYTAPDFAVTPSGEITKLR